MLNLSQYLDARSELSAKAEEAIIDALLKPVKYAARLGQHRDRRSHENAIVDTWALLKEYGIEIEQF